MGKNMPRTGQSLNFRFFPSATAAKKSKKNEGGKGRNGFAVPSTAPAPPVPFAHPRCVAGSAVALKSNFECAIPHPLPRFTVKTREKSNFRSFLVGFSLPAHSFHFPLLNIYFPFFMHSTRYFFLFPQNFHWMAFPVTATTTTVSGEHCCCVSSLQPFSSFC